MFEFNPENNSEIMQELPGLSQSGIRSPPWYEEIPSFSFLFPNLPKAQSGLTWMLYWDLASFLRRRAGMQGMKQPRRQQRIPDFWRPSAFL